MSDLAKLINIGEVLARELRDVGIHNNEDMVNKGAVESFFMIVAEKDHSCYNKLFALEGAVQGIRWHALSKEEKEVLKMEYNRILALQ